MRAFLASFFTPEMPVPAPIPRPSPTIRPRTLKPVARDLPPIAWESSPGPTEGKLTLRPESRPLETGQDAMARKIRDRYITARFSGVITDTATLADPTITIKAARLYFEDGMLGRAHELLDLATGEHPHVQPLWLAALEISFLARDADRFVRLAHGFHSAHPESPDWAEVVRMGRALAPMHPQFSGGSEGPREFDHFGPWPHLPNWIQADWDLTGEVAAAELRALVLK